MTTNAMLSFHASVTIARPRVIYTAMPGFRQFRQNRQNEKMVFWRTSAPTHANNIYCSPNRQFIPESLPRVSLSKKSFVNAWRIGENLEVLQYKTLRQNEKTARQIAKMGCSLWK